jgi:hypothetical protein
MQPHDNSRLSDLNQGLMGSILPTLNSMDFRRKESR